MISLVQDIMEDRLFTFKIGSFKNIFNFFCVCGFYPLSLIYLKCSPSLSTISFPYAFSEYDHSSAPPLTVFNTPWTFFFSFIQASWKYPVCVGFFYSSPNFPSPVNILKEP